MSTPGNVVGSTESLSGMRAPRYEHASPLFVQPKRCTGPACSTIAISLPAFHHVWTQRRLRVLEPDPECETGHHVRIVPGPVSRSVKLSKNVPVRLTVRVNASQPLSQEGSTTRYRFEKNPHERTQSRLAAPPWLGCRSPEDRSNTFLDRKTRPGSGPL